MMRKIISNAELDAVDNERARHVAEEREPQRRVDNVVAAIEAFTDAKIAYPLMRYGARNMRHVDETRERLRDALAELLS